MTPEGGFNASWQRHSACYALTTQFLGDGPVLDLGCGSGHARGHLAPRRSVGLDIDHASLASQDDRETVVADIRAIPFDAATFDSVLCVHAIEHVPDADPVLKESLRVLKPGGTAIFITPNRLTFGRPDEIIDPYHYIEYDAAQLAGACSNFFNEVTPYGVFGSERYMEFHRSERVQLDKLLRLDPLRLRRFIPRKPMQFLYDWKLTRARAKSPDGPAADFTLDDFHLRSDNLEEALDVIAVCR